jgi:L-lactate dehydrogenase complex protein LldG
MSGETGDDAKTTARDAILGRIRRSRGRGPVDELTAARLAGRLSEHRRGTVPDRVARDDDALVELFVEQAETLSATVTRVASSEDVPGAVADYLARENLPARVRAAPSPAVRDLPWDARPALEVSYGVTDGNDGVGLTGAFAAVAETGTLILVSGAERPTTLNFLPDTHVVVLHRDQIVGPYEAAWDRLRETGAMPRTVNFVSGPSRTADIEQTIQLGAHGPRRLHIVLVGDDDGE